MNIIGRWSLLTFLLWIAVPIAHGADSDAYQRLISMPVSETEEVIAPWLEKNGFSMFRATGPDLQVRLEAESAGRHWVISLKPHSPLATRIQVQPQGGRNDQMLVAFWNYLDGYVRLPQRPTAAMASAVPQAVRNQLGAVVCLYSEHNGPPLQLSGFVIDPSGLILSTAHDLKLGYAISVQFRDGREVNGRVVKIDAQRDLSLIQVPEPLETAVSLSDGRYAPGKGEMLYGLDCPHPGMGEIQSGTLDGLPKRVDGRVLWQVRMHIEPGSSGSPIFDDHGRLVGVIKGRYRGTNAVGFLIPFETLLDFLKKD